VFSEVFNETIESRKYFHTAREVACKTRLDVGFGV
jgi:hypothetical protein